MGSLYTKNRDPDNGSNDRAGKQSKGDRKPSQIDKRGCNGKGASAQADRAAQILFFLANNRASSLSQTFSVAAQGNF